MSRSFSLVLAGALSLAGVARAQEPAAATPVPPPAPAAEVPVAPPDAAPGKVVQPDTRAVPPPARPLPTQREVPGDSISDVDPIDIPPEHDPLAHAWDRPEDRGGFYLRLFTSLGVHNTRLGPAPWDSDDGREAHGFGTGFGLDIGGFIVPWLALHLDATAGMLWNGNISYEYDRYDDDESVRVAAFGLAPAATFYLPHTFFLKSAFGVGMAKVSEPGHDNFSDLGFYMDLAAGKDLYVDCHFAVGLQFQIVYMLLGDEDALDEARVRQYLFGMSVAFDSI